jgi:hypothetical protein
MIKNCNKCLSSLASESGCFYGLIDAEVIGGYESTELDDGDVHKFSLCEKCLMELFLSFKESSLQGNYLFEEVPQASGFDPVKYWDKDMNRNKDLDLERLEKNKAIDLEIEELLSSLNQKDLDDDSEFVELLKPLKVKSIKDLN